MLAGLAGAVSHLPRAKNCIRNVKACSSLTPGCAGWRVSVSRAWLPVQPHAGLMNPTGNGSAAHLGLVEERTSLSPP